MTERESWNMFDSEVLLWHFEAGVSEEFLLHLYDIRRAFEPYGAGLAAAVAKTPISQGLSLTPTRWATRLIPRKSARLRI